MRRYGRSMQVRWLTAFVDLDDSAFEVGKAFWAAATGADALPARGQHAEFVTLVPTDGDPYLRLQRLGGGPCGVHLDIHVENVRAAEQRARDLGAVLVEDDDVTVMASPAGLPVCIVAHHGECNRPTPVQLGDAPVLVDQVCVDIPASEYSDECAFWAELTGWAHHPGVLPEFSYLARPTGMPLRLLLQRLGTNDPASRARAHLDFACGEHVDEVADRHEQLGATVQQQEQYWTTMIAPAGSIYCLTSRDPVSGTRVYG